MIPAFPLAMRLRAFLEILRREYIQGNRFSPCRLGSSLILAFDGSTTQMKIPSSSPMALSHLSLPYPPRSPFSRWQTAWEDMTTDKKQAASRWTPWQGLCVDTSAPRNEGQMPFSLGS